MVSQVGYIGQRNTVLPASLNPMLKLASKGVFMFGFIGGLVHAAEATLISLAIDVVFSLNPNMLGGSAKIQQMCAWHIGAGAACASLSYLLYRAIDEQS